VERVYNKRMAGKPRAKTSGAYQLFDRIGVGGMAEVFRGIATDDANTLVAIKVILPQMRADVSFAQMFLDEARLARRIQHPNVVRVLTVGRGTDDLYLAMEYVDGLDFGELVRRGNEQLMPPSIDLVCRVVAEACAGLHAAHTARDHAGAVAPILHRDVSPQNILVSRMGDVKLSDFGIAKALGESADEGGSVRGKIPYLAPELLQGQPASVRSDIYAMAMTMYAALARLPFSRPDRTETMRAILTEPLPLLSSLVPGVPAALDALLQTAAAKDPLDRHTSAQQLQLELEEILATRPPVDVAAWARPLAGKRTETGTASRPITSIRSSTGYTSAGTSPGLPLPQRTPPPVSSSLTGPAVTSDSGRQRAAPGPATSDSGRQRAAPGPATSDSGRQRAAPGPATSDSGRQSAAPGPAAPGPATSDSGRQRAAPGPATSDGVRAAPATPARAAPAPIDLGGATSAPSTPSEPSAPPDDIDLDDL
jgi:serine/threonine protein kinase